MSRALLQSLLASQVSDACCEHRMLSQDPMRKTGTGQSVEVLSLAGQSRRNWVVSTVLAGLAVCAGSARAGSFEDFFTAIQRDDAGTLARLAGLGF